MRVTPPPPPSPPRLTVPAGIVVRVQMIDSIDSKHNHPGDEFAVTLAAPVVAGAKVVFPQGADARVRLVEAQQSGRFIGSSAMELDLASLTADGMAYKVESGHYNVNDESRGKRTAQTAGGGAGLGALIGAIAGRGKAAAIGAGAGAAAGGGIQASGHGPQIKTPSETKIDFTLKTPITVTMKTSAGADEKNWRNSGSSSQWAILSGQMIIALAEMMRLGAVVSGKRNPLGH